MANTEFVKKAVKVSSEFLEPLQSRKGSHGTIGFQIESELRNSPKLMRFVKKYWANKGDNS